MNNMERRVVVATFVLAVIYIIAFNLNVPYHWGHGERIIPQLVLNTLWSLSLILSVVTLILCIRDSGRRHLENRTGWVVYMVMFGAVGIPHYYYRYGRHPHG